MPLASYEFLVLFFPITIWAYYLFFRSARRKMFFLLAASYIFYGIADWKFIPLLFILTLFTQWGAKNGKSSLAIFANLAALGLFKYWNFGIGNFNAVMEAAGLDFAGPLLRLGLPLGLSFFVFKHIGYLIDVRMGRYAANNDFWEFATFSAYFPQISAGPISSYIETAPQFRNLPDSLSKLALIKNLVYISWGLAKKVLIADVLAVQLQPHFADAAFISGFFPAWYVVVAYAVQIYFDFSGYTDMALGLSGLFGIDLPKNFNNPYLAKNAMEFWERWHISLSRWFRYYVFSPLSRSLLKAGGAEHKERAQYVANLVTMSLVGLWHGAGWNYVLWGVFHGLLLNVNAWWKRAGKSDNSAITRPVFLLAVLIGWAFFISRDTAYLGQLFGQLLGLGGLGLEQLLSLFAQLSTPVIFASIGLIAMAFVEAEDVYATLETWQTASFVLLGIITVLALFFLQSTGNFIYVQF